MMWMDELGEALWAISDYKGGKIDIVAFDACLMGMVEVAYEIREYADIMVSSPELVDVRGFPYTILSDLTANSGIDPAALGRIMVNKLYIHVLLNFFEYYCPFLHQLLIRKILLIQ